MSWGFRSAGCAALYRTGCSHLHGAKESGVYTFPAHVTPQYTLFNVYDHDMYINKVAGPIDSKKVARV
jgi:hypothetical protein